MFAAEWIASDRPSIDRACAVRRVWFDCARVTSDVDTAAALEAGAPEGSESASGTSPFDAGLSALELAVIALSHRDPVSSVKPRGRLFGLLFGARSRLALANPKLEALRRYVVLFRREGSAPDEAGRALRDAGYTRRQIEEIDGRIALPRRMRGVWTWPFRANGSSPSQTSGER